MEFNTKLLHGKAVRAYAEGATLPPIAQVNAFRHESAEELEKIFNHRAFGYAYTRVGNPTVSAFEQRICEADAGMNAIACSSGMSAINLALLNFLTAGDEIISSTGLYGGSLDLFRDLKKFGITARYVKHLTPEEMEPLVNEHTKAIFGEVISNPGLEIMDVEKVAEFARSKGLPLVVDETTATPFLINALSLGANIVVHSTTKYINGSGDSVGGVIIDGRSFDWDFDRFRGLEDFKGFGKNAYTVRLRTDLAENFGGCMAPMTAFLNIIGLETLGVRMEKICSNAYALASALNEFPGIGVNYPLLNGRQCTEQTERLLKGMGGGILTFRAGSKEKAFKVINGLQYAVRATSIGDVRTLVIHPGSTLYINSSKEQKEAAGVFDDTVRVSVGIENVNDLIMDFTKVIKENV